MNPSKDVVPVLLQIVVGFLVCVGLLGCLAWGMKVGVQKGWRAKCAAVELETMVTFATIRSHKDRGGGNSGSQEHGSPEPLEPPVPPVMGDDVVYLSEAIKGYLGGPLDDCGDPSVGAALPYVKLMAQIVLAEAAAKGEAKHSMVTHAGAALESTKRWQHAEAACREAGARDCSPEGLRKMADVILYRRGPRQDDFSLFAELLKKACSQKEQPHEQVPP